MRPRIEQFQDEDTYRVDWIRYFEAMKAHCDRLENKLKRLEYDKKVMAYELSEKQKYILDLEQALKDKEE